MSKSKKNTTYRCETCDQTVDIVDGEVIPDCCQKPMKKVESLAYCQKPSDPEFARFHDDDAPCDDGRAG